VNRDKLTAHLLVDQYGAFRLTQAIRPSLDLQVVPREGYRRDTFRDLEEDLKVPVLAVSVSAERLFDVFLDLLPPLGGLVDVVLETSHDSEGSNHRDLAREGIDLPVVMSHFCDFEHLLLNDGCTGVAVIAHERPMEVQFDEHKLLIVYASDLRPFERVLRQAGVRRDDAMKLITEAEHLHSSTPEYIEGFEQLCCRMGVGEFASWVS
jgi:hypothetical protein